ncbi:MAG: hypothetical protein SPI52_00910, partial [Bacilli bacterium]|nr:hypothetical protein [Bacilli bacterium]
IIKRLWKIITKLFSSILLVSRMCSNILKYIIDELVIYFDCSCITSICKFNHISSSKQKYQ